MRSSNPFLLIIVIIIAVVVIAIATIAILATKKKSSSNGAQGQTPITPVYHENKPTSSTVFIEPTESEFDKPTKTKELMESIENDIMRTANDSITNAGKLRTSGDYIKAESEFLLAKSMLLNLTTIDAGYYEPYLYAVCDELGKMYYVDMHQTEKAIAMFREAYYYCNRCANRTPGSAASRDLNMIRNNLNKLT